MPLEVRRCIVEVQKGQHLNVFLFCRNASYQDEKNPATTESTHVIPEGMVEGRDGEPTPKGPRKGRRLKIVEVEGEEGAGSTEELKTETKLVRTADEAATGAEAGENKRKNAEESVKESRQPSENASLSECKPRGGEGSDATAERTLPAAEDAEGASEQTEGAAKSSKNLSGSGSRVKAVPQPELPGFVVKAKDEASELYTLGRYAEAMEKYSEIIDVLSKG